MRNGKMRNGKMRNGKMRNGKMRNGKMRNGMRLCLQHCRFNNHLYSQASKPSCNTVLDNSFFSIDLIN